MKRQLHVGRDLRLARGDVAIGLRTLRRGARDLSLIAVRERKRRAEEQAERVAPSGDALLAPVFGADRVINRAKRFLEAKVGDRARLGELQRAKVGPRLPRELLQLPERGRRLASEPRQRVGDLQRIVRQPAEQDAEPCGRRGHVEVGANDGRAELQHRDLRSRRLERGERPGRDARPVHARELFERMQIFGEQRAARLRSDDVDARERDALDSRRELAGLRPPAF